MKGSKSDPKGELRVNPILSKHPLRNSNPLSVILEAARKGQAEQVALSLIQPNPSQPRRYFSPEALEALAQSVRAKGVLLPLVLRPVGERLEIVAGERRYRAAKLAGLTHVPAVVRELDDRQAQEVALAENLQREDLNPFDETEGLLGLLALRLGLERGEVVALLNRMSSAHKGRTTHNVMGKENSVLVEETFSEVSKMSWQSFVSNRLPILGLPADVLEVLRAGRLEYTKARVIAKVKEGRSRQKLLSDALEHGLTLAQIKARLTPAAEPAPRSVASRLDRLRRNWKGLDPKRQAQAEQLLGELEKLLAR